MRTWGQQESYRLALYPISLYNCNVLIIALKFMKATIRSPHLQVHTDIIKKKNTEAVFSLIEIPYFEISVNVEWVAQKTDQKPEANPDIITKTRNYKPQFKGKTLSI